MLYGHEYAGAADAARLILIAGGDPVRHELVEVAAGLDREADLRVLAHGIETVVLIPLVVVLGASGTRLAPAAAVLASTVVFASSGWGGARRAVQAAREASMRVLIVAGIWPPDVGGPASHAPELADFLRDRGHEVAVVTTADTEPAPEPYRVDWVSRRLPVGVRHLAVAERVRSRARGARGRLRDQHDQACCRRHGRGPPAARRSS